MQLTDNEGLMYQIVTLRNNRKIHQIYKIFTNNTYLMLILRDRSLSGEVRRTGKQIRNDRQ